MISINNNTLQRAFVYSEAYGWFELPQKFSLRIPKFRLDNQRSFEHAPVYAGLKVIRHTDTAGNMLLLAPDLNGERVLFQRIDEMREELSGIVLGEQDPALFELLPGTALKPVPPGYLFPPGASPPARGCATPRRGTRDRSPAVRR